MWVWSPRQPTTSAAMFSASWVGVVGASATSTFDARDLGGGFGDRPQLWPATSTAISSPSCVAAVTVFRVAGLRATLSCSAMTRMLMIRFQRA